MRLIDKKLSGVRRVKLKTSLEKIEPQRFFVLAAVLFGSIFLLLTPPFQTPDETVHFFRAYQVSTGNLKIDKGFGTGGGYLPQALEDTVQLTTEGHAIEFHPDEKYEINRSVRALSIDEDDRGEKFYNLSATTYYPPLVYIPQAIGMVIARVLQQSPLVMMYAARLMNLIVWIVIIAYSIKIIPRKKWVIVSLGLLPMALFQATSMGADVLVVGLSTLICAIIYKTASEKAKLSSRQLVLLALILIALVLSKQIMFVLLPLVLLMSHRLFNSKRQSYLWKALFIAMPIIVFGIWMYMVRDINAVADITFRPSPTEQIKYILGNPVKFLDVLWRTYFFIPSDGIARSFIGTFGWMDAPVSEFWATLGYISLLFVMVVGTANSPPLFTKRQKVLILGIAVTFWLAVTTALYVFYNPVRYKTVIGIQGRYFLPLVPLLIPLLEGNWLRATQHNYRLWATIMPVVLLIASTITLYYRYYVRL